MSAERKPKMDDVQLPATNCVSGKVAYVEVKCSEIKVNGEGPLPPEMAQAFQDPEVVAVVAKVRCDMAEHSKNGPAMVNSKEYRDGWDRIYAPGKGNEDLN